MGALEGPDEVAHLRELHANGLERATAVVPGALNHQAVGQVGDLGAAEQAIDGLMGGLDDLEVTGLAAAGGQLRLISLALAPGLPAFAPATDEDPSAAVGGLVTEELAGCLHG